jgi:flagellar secretion chaperone FliS
MYARPNLLRARNQYQSLDLSSRIEGASPHRLVAILYEELLRSLDVLGAGLRQGKDITREPSAARARSILASLSASLDYDKGGSVAQTLGEVYRAMTRQLSAAIAGGDPTSLSVLRDGVADIAESWRQLAA